MVKEIHTSTLELFERILGPTTTSLAQKKARLIFAPPQPGLARPRNPWPTTYDLPAGIGAAAGLTVTQHAGVFSSERLDIGTRFLVENLPERSNPQTVVDLGCGNGVVGLAAGMANPHAEVTFIDESYLAVAAAEATYRAHVGPTRPAQFLVGDGLTTLADGGSVERGSVDLVLCNPPQRLHQARSDETAWRMFHESRNALRVGGELWVVGNQTLGYHAKLKRLFGNYETVASNRKFVILRAVRT
jgi:16S rRNA (guanine1207-N2)-methyltransferase